MGMVDAFSTLLLTQPKAGRLSLTNRHGTT